MHAGCVTLPEGSSTGDPSSQSYSGGILLWMSDIKAALLLVGLSYVMLQASARWKITFFVFVNNNVA